MYNIMRVGIHIKISTEKESYRYREIYGIYIISRGSDISHWEIKWKGLKYRKGTISSERSVSWRFDDKGGKKWKQMVKMKNLEET